MRCQGILGADRNVNCVLLLRQSCNKQARRLVFIHEPDGGTAVGQLFLRRAHE